MQSSELKFTQGIYGFQVERTRMNKTNALECAILSTFVWGAAHGEPVDQLSQN